MRPPQCTSEVHRTWRATGTVYKRTMGFSVGGEELYEQLSVLSTRLRTTVMERTSGKTYSAPRSFYAVEAWAATAFMSRTLRKEGKHGLSL